MGNIVLLDELTINKIAAGEVIERPASVIKEMVENSIDAGATHVTVEIKNGGISFIRITDNGKGIAKDDIELAFERHATSKIRSADDLDEIKSMGFRGEALASIAAISNVELVSKTEQDETGSRIVVEGGNVLSLDEIGCSKGTTITVRNLFFNTPVRYKFLKKDFTESGYIEDVVTRIALVHPEIALKLINTGKTVIQTSGNGDLASVIYSIFGKEVASNIINVDYEYEYMSIRGVIGKPEFARSNRSNQIFFVNKRYIKDKTLASAVEQAFKGMLPIGKFAFLVLDIEMPPSKVDVNVHPAKLEVRFADENIAFKAMFHAIKDTLLKAGIMSDREKTQVIKEVSQNAFKIENIEEKAKETYTTKNETSNQPQNIVEDIFKSRQKEENPVTNTVLENPMITSNQEIFEKLKSLQENLKKEVAQNPNLQLTDKYKEMEKKYNEIITPVLEQENKEEKTSSNATEEKVEIMQEEKEAKTKIQSAEDLEEENFIPIIFENQENDTEKQKDDTTNQEEVVEAMPTKSIDTNQLENIEESNKEDTMLAEDWTKNNFVENTQTEDLQKEILTDNQEDLIKQTPNTEQEKTTKEDKKEKILSFEEMYKELFGKEPYGGRKQESRPEKTEENFYALDENMEDSNVSMFETDSAYKKLTYKFIGIAFNTYIILEIGDELYIMDQHAAHERIMYEKVKKNFYAEGEKASQLLLLPDIITLTHKEMDIARDNFALFRKAGFMVEEFGENTVKLSGVPEVCIDLDTQELFKETLDEINTVARTAKQEKEEKFVATVACKAAVKANMELTKEEVDSLMNKLLELPNPFTCPHGRPTVIKMSKYEIERKFARK